MGLQAGGEEAGPRRKRRFQAIKKPACGRRLSSLRVAKYGGANGTIARCSTASSGFLSQGGGFQDAESIQPFAPPNMRDRAVADAQFLTDLAVGVPGMTQGDHLILAV